jgi:hypothetical protein
LLETSLLCIAIVIWSVGGFRAVPRPPWQKGGRLPHGAVAPPRYRDTEGQFCEGARTIPDELPNATSTQSGTDWIDRESQLADIDGHLSSHNENRSSTTRAITGWESVP